MQAKYANDTAKGRGYGHFVISGASPAAGEVCTFSVQRAGDGQHLGAAGWQDAEERLKPDAISVEGATLVLSVSPAVVTHLDALETHRFTLHADGVAPQRCVLELPAIVYADMGSGNGLAQITSPPPPPPVAPPQPEAEPLPNTEPLVIAPSAPLPKKSPLPLVLLGVVLLAALLGAGWWFLLRDKPGVFSGQEQPPVQSVQPKSDVPPPADPARKEPAPEPAPPVATQDKEPEIPVQAAPAPVSTPGPKEQVRAFMRKGGTPAEAMSLSQSLPKDTAEGQDANFLVLEMAAEGGDPMAMIGVARYYDPADSAPAGTIAKDMEQAWIWYSKALKAGASGARADLDRLVAWLKQQATSAASGTTEIARQAQDLLQRIEKVE